MAFLALPTQMKNLLKVAAPTYLYSGPSPTASLATVLAGLQVNDDRGDGIRADFTVTGTTATVTGVSVAE